jgi:hypothetical protein
MAALPGFKASVYLTSLTSLSMSNTPTTDSGAHTTYSISTAAYRYLDPLQAITVQTSPDGTTGWSTVTSGFTLQHVGGIVTFTTPLTGSAPSVRISGYYKPYSVVGEAKAVDVTTSIDLEDATTFADAGWKTKQVVQAGAQVKITKWWIDPFYASALRNLMVLVVYSGANPNQRYEGFAYLKTDAIKIAEKNLTEEDLDFEIHGALYALLS